MIRLLSILFLLAPLLAFSQPVPPTNAVMSRWPVHLAWDASPDDTVIGYNLYSGPASGAYTNRLDVGTNCTGTVLSPISAPVFYVVTAYNAAGLESIPSNEVTNTVVRPITPPALRVITVQSSVSVTNPLGTEFFALCRTTDLLSGTWTPVADANNTIALH